MHSTRLGGTVSAIALVFCALPAGRAVAQPGPYIAPAWKDFRGPSFSLSQRIVTTYYFYWYDRFSGYHMDITDHPDYWNDPDVTFSWSDPDWHALEAGRMVEAGIDIMLPVYWGGDPERFPHENWWSNVGLDGLREGLLANVEARRANPKVGMFYDTTTLMTRPHPLTGRTSAIDLTTPAGLDQFYRTIRDFYSRVPPEHWARINRRAIVWLYSSAFPARFSKKTFDEARKRFARDFGGVGLFFVGDTGWRTPQNRRLVDRTYAWGAAARRDGIVKDRDIVSIGPGFDYPLAPQLFNSRRDGLRYRDAWEDALKTRKSIIAIETWNEWYESTSVAPSLQDGAREFETTREYTRRFHSRGRSPRRARPQF